MRLPILLVAFVVCGSGEQRAGAQPPKSSSQLKQELQQIERKKEAANAQLFSFAREKLAAFSALDFLHER